MIGINVHHECDVVKRGDGPGLPPVSGRRAAEWRGSRAAPCTKARILQ